MCVCVCGGVCVWGGGGSVFSSSMNNYEVNSVGIDIVGAILSDLNREVVHLFRESVSIVETAE